MLGGKCCRCGYKKSLAALSFHHLDPDTKKFDLGHNGGIMMAWEIVVQEAQKCELLCLNCHSELENDKRNKR